MRSTFIKVCLSFVAVLLLSNAAFAANLAVFNLTGVTQNSDAAKALEVYLDKTYGTERDKLMKDAEAIQKKTQEFQKQAAALSEKARKDKGTALEKEVRAFEERRTKFAQKIGPEQQKKQTEILELVRTACVNYSKANKLDILIDGSASVAYASETVDVSQGILAEVNKLWKDKGGKFAD